MKKTVNFNGTECHALFSTYLHGGNIAITLLDAETGENVATATLNPEVKLQHDEVCIKDYSENEGMTAALVDAGIIAGLVNYLPTGFVNSPVYKLVEVPFQEELVKEVSHINWVAKTEPFTTWEFVTCDDIWIDEADMDTDLFRLFVWKNGNVEVMVANSEDYDIHEDVSHLFDLDYLQATFETAVCDDYSESYNEYYTKAQAEPTTVIDFREKETYTKRCRMCEEDVSFQAYEQDFDKWEQGAHTQDAFPYLTPGERELLISGTCDKCWKKMFG